MKRIATYITVLAVLFAGLGFTGTADAAVYKYGIYMVGAKAKTVYAGDDLELKVTKGSALREDQIKWTISNTSVLKFEDGERYGDDVEVIGLKKGSAKVTVQNLKTGAKGSYTVTVKQANKYGIKMVGSKTRSVYAGSGLELKVTKGSALREDQIKWTIANTSILKYEDGERYGDDIEVIGLKKGTTKVTVQNLKTGAKGSYTVTVKMPSSYGIKMVGSKTRTIEAGDDVELRVSKGSALANSQIKWTISNTSILRFEDGINKGQSVEVEGIRSGTAKVTVQNLATGAKGSYTIKVVPDYD